MPTQAELDDGSMQFMDIEGSGSYGNKNNITYQEVLMNQLSRITKIQSQEMRAGFWKTLPVRMGGTATTTQKIWISDSRKEFISAIQCFHDILLPKFDEEMNKAKKQIDEDLKKTKKSYSEKDILETKYVDYEMIKHRELFQQLNLLISRQGYFEEQEMWG